VSADPERGAVPGGASTGAHTADPTGTPTDVPTSVPTSAPPGSRTLVEPDAWTALRAFTPARIALGRTGSSQPTSAQLAFGLAHAQARDAVHAPLDVAALDAALRGAGFDTLIARSRAADRPTYLRRPDLGRRLDEASPPTACRRWRSPDTRCR